MDGLERFAAEAGRFADFYWSHMQKEEDQVLPIADRVLADDDWRDIHAAFAANQDPNFSSDAQDEFKRLFTRIVHLTPAPMGLGPA